MPGRAESGARAPNQNLAALRYAWITYLCAVLAIAAGVRAIDARVDVALHVAVHGGLLLLVWWLPVDHRASRAAWSLVVLAGLLAVFSAVGLVLPALHPQPFEWRCIAADRFLFGCDPTVAAQAWLSPWLVEILQAAYASFYFLPVAVLVALLVARRWAEYDACLCTVAVGFLLSYLGYYLCPTLPPYRYLDHGGPLVGLGFAERVHALLDALEANRFDCMPSGHTMLALMTLALARRHAPRVFLLLLPVAVLLLAATVALRYHYAVDVVAGAVLAPVGLRAARWLLAARHGDS